MMAEEPKDSDVLSSSENFHRRSHASNHEQPRDASSSDLISHTSRHGLKGQLPKKRSTKPVWHRRLSLQRRLSMQRKSCQNLKHPGHTSPSESSDKEGSLPMTLHADARRKMLSQVMFSLSQLSLFFIQGKTVDQLPEEHRCRRMNTICVGNNLDRDSDDVIYFSENMEMKNFQKEYYRWKEEATQKRKYLRVRKRWLRAYRKIQSMLCISKNMAELSMSFEKKPSTYVDIGDTATVFLDYGAGRSIDIGMYRRRKEISISAEVSDTLTSVPEGRTLVQLEKARRELQKVRMFSEYPINVQEQILRRAFYIKIGPKRVILRQGHLAHDFYINLCGQAYVKRHVWDEERGQMVAKVDAFIKTGDTFGSFALTHDVPRTYSVISRTNMQLLAICGEDYLDLIFRRSLPGQLPPHIQYLSSMNFMENFPIHLLEGKLSVCAMHHFRRNAVITHDSKKCSDLFIIQYGYCKVFRRLDSRVQADLVPQIIVSGKNSSSDSISFSVIAQNSLDEQRYIERSSTHVNYKEMQSPAGHTVRLPVTKLPGNNDKMHHQPLTLPQERRQFVPLMLLREGEVFGFDQTPLCPSRDKSRSTILVSLGAEVIALKKDFYCHHATDEGREVVEKTFIFDDIFIRRRLRERVYRDVHLEEVLKFYFMKFCNGDSKVKLPHIHL